MEVVIQHRRRTAASPPRERAVAAGAPSVGVTTSQSPAALFGAGASLCVADFADARLGEALA